MSDKDQRALKRTKLLELVGALAGSPEQLADAELDRLYRQVKPDEDPRAWVRSAAAEAARSYRLRKEKVVYHVQTALDATKPESVEASSPSALMDLVDSLLGSAAPARRFQPAALTLRIPEKELSAKDRAILEGLSDEISNQKDNPEDDS
jgi:hypothetical protein